jgi:hypothetical protein
MDTPSPLAPPCQGLHHGRAAQDVFRHSPELQAALYDRVRQGQRVSDIIREALEVYLGLRPTDRPTRSPTARPTRQPPAAPQQPQRPTASTHDPDAAYARMQALQSQGLTLAQIAAQMTAEGRRTRYGKAWHKSRVAYVLKTHGR